jgi:small conductance mechanosensitive channel
MRTSVVRIAVLPIFLCLCLGPGSRLHAQESTGGSKTGDSLDSAARELTSSLDERKEELDRLNEQLKTAAGDDRTALRERSIDLAEAFLADLGDLAANVVEREEQGLDAAEDRARVTETSARASQLLRAFVDRTQEDLKRLRESKDGASPDELDAIEKQLLVANTWLDRTLEMLVTIAAGMEDFGLDTAGEREFLTEHLTERAELVAGRIMLTREARDKIERRLKADPTSAEIAAALDRTEADLDRNVARLGTTIRLMEELELDTADYQQLLFQVTGEITTGLFSRDVLSGLARSWVDSSLEWLGHNGPSLILKLVIFVLILIAFRIFSRIARRVVRQAITTSNLGFSTLLERTALSVTSTVVMIFGLLVALSQLGFQVGPLLAGLGVVGFIVGFALQDTLSNFASGVMILLYRPYDVGDLVEVAGGFGKVQDMTLVTTTILTLDHQTLVIPNNKIWGDVIKNVTAQKKRRVDMVFGIGYADDIPHAERVLREIVESHEKVLDDPEPIVRLHTLNDSSVDFIVRPWVATEDYWDVYWDITREVKIRFDAEGISIPFPQRDVHIYQEDGENNARGGLVAPSRSLGSGSAPDEAKDPPDGDD